MIGGIIMTHGDNSGLVLPPRIAPIQAMVIPVAQHKPGVLDAANGLLARLKAAGIRAAMDDSDQSMGWKAAQYEMKGVPLRVEIGPKDMEKNQCCICRRDSGEKVFVSLDELEITVSQLLDAVHDGLYQRAKKNLEDHSKVCMTLDEVKEFMESEGGFARLWCGDPWVLQVENEGAGRCLFPVYAPPAGACKRRVRLLRQARQALHPLGCGLLSRLTGKTEKPSGYAACILSLTAFSVAYV